MSKTIVVDTAASGWSVAARRRRDTVLHRLGLAAAIALVVTPMLGWRVCFGWAMAYALSQLLELAVLSPASRRTDREMSRRRRFAAYAALFASACLFGALSIPMWFVGGPLGGVCASLMLPGQMLFSMINAPRSKGMLISTLAPPLLLLISAPVFAAHFGASAPVVMTASAAVILFVIFIVISWQIVSDAAENHLRAHAEADRLRRKAEQDLAAHTAFLAAVAHDLRTPIGAILTGAAEIQAPDAATRAGANLITDAGLMMKALLDDLLDHTRIGAGRMTVEAADFDLRAMLAQTLRLWRGPVLAKGLKLRVEGAARIPRSVRGDAMRIRQVLNNLMSNAVKFTPEGEITLRLDAWAEEPSGYAVLIEVADTGPGMTAEQMARLFTPFDQTADGVSAQHGGSGLGLSISRDLTELMGGRLTARSAPGEGAHFTVSLFLPRGQDGAAEPSAAPQIAHALTRSGLDADAPVGLPLTPPTASEAAPPPASPPVAQDETPDDGDRPLRLLVVDDHDINRRAVQLILEPLGCDILTAANGMIALDLCAEAAFDVIFMDVRMPELDGRETTRRLRAGDGPNARTPVIAVTADTAPEDVALCQAAGMAYFVSKPLTPAALISALQHVLDDAAQASESAQAVETQAA